jgi:cell division protein FtsX
MVFLTATAAFSFASLENIKAQLLSSLAKETSQYRWLVLVRGTQIELDEIGLSLEKLPGIDDASFVSSENAFRRLKDDPYLTESLTGLTSTAIPSAWEVRWSADFDIESQDANLAEARSWPGVIDIAMDEKALSTIQMLRKHVLGVRVLLSGLMCLLVLSGIFVGLRLLFSEKTLRFQVREFLGEVALLFASWSLGLVFIWALTGHVAWAFLPFGLILGAIVWGWRAAS